MSSNCEDTEEAEYFKLDEGLLWVFEDYEQLNQKFHLYVFLPYDIDKNGEKRVIEYIKNKAKTHNVKLTESFVIAMDNIMLNRGNFHKYYYVFMFYNAQSIQCVQFDKIKTLMDFKIGKICESNQKKKENKKKK